jgi:phage tail sheath gpL-like
MPSNIGASSIAAAVGVGVQNVQFSPIANTLPRRGVLIGTYDETNKTEIVPDQPYLVTSAAEVGALFGFGFMLHQAAEHWYLGAGGIETWVIPQLEDAGVAYAQGTITITASSASAGTYNLYIAGISVPVTVAAGDDGEAIAASVKAAIDADGNLPVTATVALNVVTVDSKAGGLWGNFINLSDSWGFKEVVPADITSIVYVQPTGGSGLPDIQDALDALGLNDDQNEKYFTELWHGYMQDTTTLDALSTWNGVGNGLVGNYSEIVSRPLLSLVGDTAAGSSGLTNLIALGDSRKQDRTSGVIPAPGSPTHPQVIAAQTLGIRARINNNIAAEHYLGKPLVKVIPGSIADRWTSSNSSLDTALKAGISGTTFSGGSLTLTDIATFYHPDSVPVTSNGYALQVNVSKIQNITNSIKETFQQEKWQGIFIVSDVSRVTNTIDNQKARDILSVQNDVLALVFQWESRGWIKEASFTIDLIRSGGYISVRPGGTGFDIVIPVLLSGTGRIFNSLVQFDPAFTVSAA